MPVFLAAPGQPCFCSQRQPHRTLQGEERPAVRAPRRAGDRAAPAPRANSGTRQFQGDVQAPGIQRDRTRERKSNGELGFVCKGEVVEARAEGRRGQSSPPFPVLSPSLPLPRRSVPLSAERTKTRSGGSRLHPREEKPPGPAGTWGGCRVAQGLRDLRAQVGEGNT